MWRAKDADSGPWSSVGALPLDEAGEFFTDGRVRFAKGQIGVEDVYASPTEAYFDRVYWFKGAFSEGMLIVPVGVDPGPVVVDWVGGPPTQLVRQRARSPARRPAFAPARPPDPFSAALLDRSLRMAGPGTRPPPPPIPSESHGSSGVGAETGAPGPEAVSAPVGFGVPAGTPETGSAPEGGTGQGDRFGRLPPFVGSVGVRSHPAPPRALSLDPARLAEVVPDDEPLLRALPLCASFAVAMAPLTGFWRQALAVMPAPVPTFPGGDTEGASLLVLAAWRKCEPEVEALAMTASPGSPADTPAVLVKGARAWMTGIWGPAGLTLFDAEGLVMPRWEEIGFSAPVNVGVVVGRAPPAMAVAVGPEVPRPSAPPSKRCPAWLLA